MRPRDLDADARPAGAAVPARARPHSGLSLSRRLRLQQLVVFEKVVEAGSILAASRELHLTQPAVSKCILEIEQQLGGVLFVRGKRGVTLTEFGALFERHVKTMTAELRYLADEMNAWQTGSAGQLTVGTLIVASPRLLPEAIVRLRAKAPGVAVTVHVGTNASLFPALARGELDVVVGVLPEQPRVRAAAERAVLTHVPLYSEAMCVVVDCRHPLARRRKLRLAELQDYDWVVPTPESSAIDAVRAMFEGERLPMPARVVESVSILTNLGLITHGAMVAMMQRSAAERLAKAGLLTILPLRAPKVGNRVGYTLRADRTPGAVVQRFIAALQEVGRELQRIAR